MTELKTIICIDDEPDILELIKMSLETVGNYNVVAYKSGADALACIQGEEPDLIIIDSMMPDMNGMELLVELRKMDEIKSTPIVFMTARIQPQEKEEYLNLGAIAVIPKPFDPMELASQVKEAWDTHLSSCATPRKGL